MMMGARKNVQHIIDCPHEDNAVKDQAEKVRHELNMLINIMGKRP
jgi:hypothetical protein